MYCYRIMIFAYLQFHLENKPGWLFFNKMKKEGDWMKVYLVSFPSDIPVLKRIKKMGKKEILLSYYFLKDEKDPMLLKKRKKR